MHLGLRIVESLLLIKKDNKKNNKQEINLDSLIPPDLPYPYIMGLNHGIYIKATEEDDPEVVYEHDLRLLQRYRDPMKGEVVLMKHTLPMDGARAIIVAAKELVGGDEAKKVLAHYGVLSNRKQMDRILNYIINYFKHLQTIQHIMVLPLRVIHKLTMHVVELGLM